MQDDRKSREIRTDGALVYIRLLRVDDAAALLELRLRNLEFLRPWEPRRAGGPPTIESQRAQLRHAEAASDDDTAYHFGVFTPDDRMVGTITLSNVARGAWQNATVGYFIDEAENGKGYATEAIRLAARTAFGELGLHRVQAGVMPRNPGSMRALEKAGFRHEGLSPRYLRINGVWEDHVMFALTQEDVSG